MKNKKILLPVGIVICIAIILFITIFNISGSNKFKDIIIEKWKVTLPLNNTNGLEYVVYNSNNDYLYLMYNYGVCLVTNDNEITRYVQGDFHYNIIESSISDAKESKDDNIVYMTATEFNKLIENVKWGGTYGRI